MLISQLALYNTNLNCLRKRLLMDCMFVLLNSLVDYRSRSSGMSLSDNQRPSSGTFFPVGTLSLIRKPVEVKHKTPANRSESHQDKENVT